MGESGVDMAEMFRQEGLRGWGTLNFPHGRWVVQKRSKWGKNQKRFITRGGKKGKQRRKRGLYNDDCSKNLEHLRRG